MAMGMKITALIVDDENSARKLLQSLLADLQCFGDIRMAGSASSAREILLHFDPDIIFVDIKMPVEDGFSFVTNLPIKELKPAIVFVTAYDQFAIKAIKNQAFDYMLKPVDRRELKICVEKFIENKHNAENHVNEKFSRIRINTRTGTIFINPATILYCKADGNYTIICTGGKQHLCSMNLGKVEELLTGKWFFRLGRSHIINREYITMLDRKESIVVLVREGETARLRIPRHHLKELDNI
jgi:two-component system LytT family response regulator